MKDLLKNVDFLIAAALAIAFIIAAFIVVNR